MRRTNRPPARRTVVFALAVAGALVVDACSSGTQDGQVLAQQACAHVLQSVADYQRAGQASTPPDQAAQLQIRADKELRDALPLAAEANSDDGSWNSLMTTISEGAVVDEGHLVPALRAQCELTEADQNTNPRSPGTTTPKNVNPRPATPAG